MISDPHPGSQAENSNVETPNPETRSRSHATRRPSARRPRPRAALKLGYGIARFLFGTCFAGSALGCAQYAYQYVNVRSEPGGAQVFIDGKLIGRTPLQVTVERTRDHIVFLKLDGYVPEREVLTLNRARDRIDFLTPADVELELSRRASPADTTRAVDVELEKNTSTP